MHSFIFVVSFSLTTLILQQIDLSTFCYHTENGTSIILGPIAAGVISGYTYGLVFCRDGSTGGMDVIAAWVRHYHPEYEFVNIIFYLNASVAVLSFFVYDYQFEPVIMCIIYCAISTYISGRMLKGRKKALKFEIITDSPEALSEQILCTLRHGVTIVRAEGAYSHTEKHLLICVVNPHQVMQFHRVLSRFPSTFSYVSEVNEPLGNFKKIHQ